MKLRTFAHGVLVALFAMALLLSPPGLRAKTGEKTKDSQEQGSGGDQKEGKDGASLERVPNSVYESLQNKASNVQFYSTNYGVFGLNPAGTSAPGGWWPRGSNNGYIFGGGLWFAALKKVAGIDSLQKLCAIGYNPNSGAGWFVPGRVSYPLDKSAADGSPDAIQKYRMYFSTDYNNGTGKPYDPKDLSGWNWPVWDVSLMDSLRTNRYLGFYVDDKNSRDVTVYKKGPAIISGEDIFSTYKDTDLSRYEQGRSKALAEGYPLGLQVEQTVYSWGFGLYADFFFLRYMVINTSSDTLQKCYVAPAMDMDIGFAGNDHSSIVIPDKSQDNLNLAAQWSDYTSGDGTRGYGYIGADFLESPAVWRAGDSAGVDGQGNTLRVGDSIGVDGQGNTIRLHADDLYFIRHDKRVFEQKEQIGLTTFRSWLIAEDPKKSNERYDFLSSARRDVDPGPGDKRFLMATGPFNMRPGDTARVVVGIMFAYQPNRSQAPTGTRADMKNLIAVDTFAQHVYDDNFAAPTPPDPANVTWHPLNNGVQLNWDDRSEISFDKLERGLDFAGYTIRRYRKGLSGANTTDSNGTWNLTPKVIATIPLPPIPDSATRYRAARTGDLALLGPWYRLPMLADTGNPGVDTLVSRQFDTTRVYTDSIRVHPDGTRDTVKVLKSKTVVKTFDTTEVYNFNYNGYSFDPYADLDPVAHYDGSRFGGKFAGQLNKDIVRAAITSIMDSLTHGRTFIDVGDDNQDGQVSENEDDLSKNERLLNNVDYYYQVLAYDAGSTEEHTPSKSNSAIAGINEIKATPEAPASGYTVTPTIVGSNGLGGIFNFHFNTLDADRLGQLFGGDTIHFEFQPVNLQNVDSNTVNFYYANSVTATSKRTGQQLLRFYVPYDFKFTDRADSALNILVNFFNGEVLLPYQSHATDTSFYNAKDVRSTIVGSYTPDPARPQVNTVGIYNSTFSVGFDYSITQYGDSLRFGKFGDASASPFTKTSTQSDVNLVAGKQIVGRALFTASGRQPNQIPSIGQPKIEVEFQPGGVEPTISFVKRNKRYTFSNIPYLTMKVRNIAGYQREVVAADGSTQSTAVQYNYEYPVNDGAQAIADTTPSTTPLEYILDPTKFALYAYGWFDVDGFTFDQRKAPITRSNVNAGRIGTANRYYLSYDPNNGNAPIRGTDSTGASHTLSFTHKLIVNGAEIIIDAAGMGSTDASPIDANNIPQTPPTTEFKAGDKFTVDFTGGALGLPQPGATVDVAIPQPAPKLDQYTDDLLDQIQIVPNPYLIDHLGQSASDDRRLYITKLPEECTIQIYTAAGELIQTINHKAGGTDGRIAVNAWDLLTQSQRQVQSQLLVFRITTPNGAETIKKCAVVVGGFRLLGR